MPFLYDVLNVKLQLYARGLVWSRGGGGWSTSVKLFLFSICWIAKTVFSIHIFNWYLSNEKNNFADNSSVEPALVLMEKLSFSMKIFSGHFYGQSFIKTVRGPFRLEKLSFSLPVLLLSNSAFSFTTAWTGSEKLSNTLRYDTTWWRHFN